MSIRTERVASLIREEIAGLLVREYSDPAWGFTTVTDVRMTADLRIARVYFSIFGSPEIRAKTFAALEADRSHIRGIVGSHLRMRFVPDLEFYQDDSLDRVERINRIIKTIHANDTKNEGGT
jgi:ribosome-binding factor A